MAEKIILTAMVLKHNIVGLIAAYSVRLKTKNDEVFHGEIYFEVILRESHQHYGGIDCEDAVSIFDGDDIIIEVEEKSDGAFEIIDIKPKERREFHMRNTLRL